MHWKDIQQWAKSKLLRAFAPRHKVSGEIVEYPDGTRYRVMADGSYRRVRPKTKNYDYDDGYQQ